MSGSPTGGGRTPTSAPDPLLRHSERRTQAGGEWRTIAIIGVGLIGGSFALALRKAGFGGRIIGVSSRRSIEIALHRGVIDEALPLAEAVAKADLVYLSQPVRKIIETLDSLDEYARPGALITDAGSTKIAIVVRALQKIHRATFVGGHPLAGKESRGVAEADACLFEGRPYVLTGRDPQLEAWIKRIGARLVILDAEGHDRLVSMTSHLPQLVSTALAEILGAEPEAARVAGPGAIEMTRLALSPYEVWSDILATNREPIAVALDYFIAKLEELRNALGSPEMERHFARAAAAARELREG